MGKVSDPSVKPFYGSATYEWDLNTSTDFTFEAVGLRVTGFALRPHSRKQKKDCRLKRPRSFQVDLALFQQLTHLRSRSERNVLLPKTTADHELSRSVLGEGGK